MSRENWIRTLASGSTSVSPCVGALKTTSGAGSITGTFTTASGVLSVGGRPTRMAVASRTAIPRSSFTTPATSSQRPVSMRFSTFRSKPSPFGRRPVTQIEASADCRTKSKRPLPGASGRSP